MRLEPLAGRRTLREADRPQAKLSRPKLLAEIEYPRSLWKTRSFTRSSAVFESICEMSAESRGRAIERALSNPYRLDSNGSAVGRTNRLVVVRSYRDFAMARSSVTGRGIKDGKRSRVRWNRADRAPDHEKGNMAAHARAHVGLLLRLPGSLERRHGSDDHG
jgi:hypothetical protein